MSKRGRPELTDADASKLPRIKDFSEMTIGEHLVGGIGALVIFFVICWLIMGALRVVDWIVSEPNSGPAVSAVSVSSPSSQQSTGSYYRVFRSAEGGSLTLVLANGNYSLSFETRLSATVPVDAAIFDFSTGQVTGDPTTADTIVVRGNVNLQIGEISELDTLRARINDFGTSAYAHFDYSPHRLPTAVPRRRVIVVGSIRTMTLPGGAGGSTSDIRVLALGGEYWTQSEDRTSVNEPSTPSRGPTTTSVRRSNTPTRHTSR
jgi:hypothetical protein